MSEESQTALTTRIERALDRIEAALASAQSRPAPSDEQLSKRHAALRTSAEAALRDLDGLIAREEER